MTTSSTFRTILLCGILLAGSIAAEAQAAETGSFQQTISVNEPIHLDVSAGSGKIDIRSGGSGQATIIGHIKVRGGSVFGLFKSSNEDLAAFVEDFENNPPVSLENGQLLVGHVKNNRFGRNASISYEIVVPANTRVTSNTGSGSQTIVGVAGPVEVKSGSGRLMLEGINGPVSARAGSGSITAEGIAGSFEAHAGSGRIRLTQSSPGDVVVTTGSGSSELHNVVGTLRAKTGSGRIKVNGRQEGDWKLNTGSGSVRVSLPDDASFEIDAEAGSGGVEIEHPVTMQGKISKRHVRGIVRDGGNMLEIDTGSGSIKVD